MTNSVYRSIAIGALTLGVWAAGQILWIVAFCPSHQAWTRAQHEDNVVVLDRGERVARPGDAIFVCETPHSTGPILWHEDLGCYCAPAATTAEQLSRIVNGSCTLDKASPTRADQWGACRFARCSQHED